MNPFHNPIQAKHRLTAAVNAIEDGDKEKAIKEVQFVQLYLDEYLAEQKHRPNLPTLLRRVIDAYLYKFPLGTVGGDLDESRSRNPKPGDFVVVLYGMQTELRSMGYLREHKGESQHDGWTIECLDGNTITWSNCEVRAIPVGDIHELSKGKEHVRWQTVPPVGDP